MDERRRSRDSLSRVRSFPILFTFAFVSFCGGAGAAAKQVEKGPHRHFELEAGDASLMLNEFSRQSDLQVLFDFNILSRVKTRAVAGDLDAADAVRSMLKDTDLVFDFVNDRTLAVTPRKPSLFSRLWHRLKTREKHAAADELDQVLISGRYGDHLNPPPGAPLTQLDRTEIDRAGVATVPDLLRTIPQIWGGGPAEGNIRGYEQGTNTGLGNGTNFRGLGAGSTIALLNGREIAPSGNSAAFSDISNIPLSAIDHVEIVPEGGSIPYGPQAVGGIINFVMRDRFEGAEAQARFGAATGGALREHQASLLLGNHIGEARGIVAFEYYRRESLPASDRAQATSDLTPFGGSNFDTVFGNPGTITDGTQSWAIPKHQDGTSLSAAQLIAGTQNLHDQFEGTTILPQQQRFNFYANGSVPVSDDIQLSTDILFADRRFAMSHSGFQVPLIVPNTNPFYVNPAGGSDPVMVDYGFGDDLGPMQLHGVVQTGNISVGLTRVSDGGWNTTGHVIYTYERENLVQDTINSAALTASLADSNPATAFNPFGDGSHTNPTTLAALRGQQRTTSLSQVYALNVSADRTLVQLPAGAARIQLGLDAQRELLDTPANNPSIAGPDEQTRNVIAAFGELRVPVFGEEDHIPALKRLDISIADRVSRYSQVGSVNTPTLTGNWAPFEPVNVRSSLAYFYKPPNLKDLSEINAGSELYPLPDSRSSTGQTLALISFGGNRDLKPERARNWTLGIDYRPLPDLTLSATGYSSLIKGRSDSLMLTASVLDDPNSVSFVTRNPTAAQVSAVCRKGTLVGPVDSCLSGAVGAIVQGGLLNIDTIRTDGIDWATKYSPVLGDGGQLRLGVVGTYVRDFSEALVPGGALQPLVNTEHEPLSLRLRAEVGYAQRGFEASSFANFSNAYRDTASVPTRGVSPWTTVDLQLSYQFAQESAGLLAGVKVSFSVLNVFGIQPPFLNAQLDVGYDRENASLYERQTSLTLRKNW